jgi:neutral ceramidase
VLIESMPLRAPGRRALLAVLGLLLTGCCSSHEAPLRITQPPTSPPPPAPALYAAVAETDITPPPELPFFGYSIAAKPVRGYWTRLHARIFAFADPSGTRLAIVQLDLGASSALLQRLVAAQLAPDGIDPADVLLLSTHTHGGPGGYFGSCFYNILGARSPGFDPRFTEWLAARIASAAHGAFQNLTPAAVRVGSVDVPFVSRNRSLAAWKRNFQGTPPYDGVLPHLVVLRVDRTDAAAPTPLGVLLFFPIHGTAVGHDYRLYRGDLHAVTERLVAARLARHYGVSNIVAAFADGPEGDVSPNWKLQVPAEARCLGQTIAEAAITLAESLDSSPTAASVAHAYAEIPLPGAATTRGAVCDYPAVGMATLGGAADGYTFLYALGFREGKVRHPRDCQTVKRTAFGPLQSAVVSRDAFTTVAPLHAIQFGKLLTIVTVPGEPTTETGRQIAAAVSKVTDTPKIVVAAHADDYLGYVATAAEYSAQSYEGSSSFFGENESAFFVDQLPLLVQELAGGAPAVPSWRTFRPGRVHHFLGSRPCEAGRWRPLDTHAERDSAGHLAVTFTWQGLEAGHTCDELPGVEIECGGAPLLGPEGVPENDSWLNFEVRREGRRRWRALWRPDWPVPPSLHCHVRVGWPYLPVVISTEFTTDGVLASRVAPAGRTAH